ncbi:MAG: hypothetical protein ETSY2_49055 [Candidatus Entotheonella gemina]|uniref:Uncharacterized protein n=1 Tax=Candidatus Entotheonella gemina TaxID=1429439 RepID=W4LC22_9BACT|nr:MAG: hypothetical protein ETSY2_49055 [Candidatus Entotheonella gemina]
MAAKLAQLQGRLGALSASGNGLEADCLRRRMLWLILSMLSRAIKVRDTQSWQGA